MNACGCVIPRPGCSCGYTGPLSVPTGTYRHADSVTMDHIIELRREILKLEKTIAEYQKQLSNALDVAIELRKQLIKEHHGTHVTDQ